MVRVYIDYLKKTRYLVCDMVCSGYGIRNKHVCDMVCWWCIDGTVWWMTICLDITWWYGMFQSIKSVSVEYVARISSVTTYISIIRTYSKT